MAKGSRVLAVAAALLVLAAGRAEAGGIDRPLHPSLAAYRGSGSWVSLYDTKAWRNPERVVARLAAHGVRTLYLETSNDRQRTDVVDPEAISRFVEAAHGAGIAVVGWYLPSFTTPRRDVRRALSGIRFRSESGDRFDAFALDVESTAIRSVPKRTRRAVAIVAAIRRAIPAEYPLGAITIDPAGGRYWPGYPFAQLARSVSVFLPMAYFTARTSGALRVRAYTRANVQLVRTLAGDAAFPVHPIGGEARHATLRELHAFLDESSRCATLGASLWEYAQTTPTQWSALSRA